MSPERLISLIAARGVHIGYIPGGGRPEWTAQEAAMACNGLPEHVYEALAFTYAGDGSKLWALQRVLSEFGFEQCEAGGWRQEVCEIIPQLAELWLLEVQQPWRFARKENSPNPDLRRVIIGVDKDSWRRHYSDAYETIGMEFTIWISIGVRRMKAWLRN